MWHHLETMMLDEEERSALFIEHVLNESKLHIEMIEKFLDEYKLRVDTFQVDLNQLYAMQLSKLFLFGYNNNSDIETNLDYDLHEASKAKVALSHLSMAWIEKFGLDSIRAEGNVSKRKIVGELFEKFTSDLELDFFRIFSTINSSDENNQLDKILMPLKLEICSGQGEWVVTQAKHDSFSRWIALELRCNRVYDIFTNAILQKVDNLCILQGDARYIIPDCMPNSSIDCVFINHPEPPQRVVGKGATQGQHLLTSNFFDAIHRLMVKNGKLSIVSDNLPYMEELTVQLAIGLEGKFVSGYFAQGCRSYIKETESGGISLWRGDLPEETGVTAEASSYFDRLWTRGQKVRRWFLFVEKR